MANNKIDNLTIEGARIMFRNFSGKEGKFNRAGDRNFCVIIDDPDMVKKLAKDGWNIKVWQPKDEDAEPVNYIPVKLRYDMVPPKVYRISSITGKQLLMTEDMIDAFDSEDFRNDFVAMLLRKQRYLAERVRQMSSQERSLQLRRSVPALPQSPIG